MGKSALLRRIDFDLRKVERAGVAAARKVAEKFIRRTITSYRKYGDIEPEAFEETFRKPLFETMYAVSLAGRRRGQLLFKQRKSLELSHAGPLKLSAMLDIASYLEGVTDLQEVERIQEEWDTYALRMLQDTAPAIEKQLRATMTELTVTGTDTRKGTRVLRELFDALGLSPKNGSQIETIFRTQTQLAYQAGRWQGAQDPDIQEITWGYEYFTVEDNRVRPAHAALNGVKLPKDDPFWYTFWPPNGWNCRCQVLPIFERVRAKSAPAGVQPDKGFAFNSGVLFQAS